VSKFFAGQILSLPYRDDHLMRVIVIDPDGQGLGRPSLGMGFGMTEENLGLPKSTLSRWTEGVANKERNTPEASPGKSSELLQDSIRNTPTKLLKSPSGAVYRVLQILDETGNQQMVIEGCDWVDLACDVLDKPGKVKSATLEKLNNFVRWLAKKGFYATVYAQILGAYTKADDDVANQRIQSLETENQQLKEEVEKLKEETYEVICANALLEHRNDQLMYENDELADIAQWRIHNSFTGRDR